jgi:hypothetical protein
MRKLFLAVPTLNGQIFDICVDSIFKNINYLRERGYDSTLFILPCHIYIEKARNICVNEFLKSECTDLVFIDADLGFEEDAVYRLMQYDKDIIGGVYPFKQDNLDFPVKLDFSHENNCKEESTGLVYVDIITTGLLRIKREVFEEIIKSDFAYKIEPDKDGLYTFFQTGILFDDKEYYGEDVAFCKAWRNSGKEIFAVPDMNFIHKGYKSFKGNLHEHLISRKVDNIDKCTGIKGWSTETELAALKEFASISDSVVEIGSWKGRSTKELLENCKGTVYAVDTWEGSKEDISGMIAKEQDIFSEFMKNVGDYSNLKILKGKSVDIAEKFEGSVDMVFIDADHSYEAVKADIEAWLPKCKKIFCGHDYSLAFPGVLKAVNEKFDIKYKADTLWWVEI